MAGRPSKYEERVKPYLDQIRKWKEQGADNRTIAKQLGVSMSTFSAYLNQYPELSEIVKNYDKKPIVEELRSTLVKRALGFTYEEKKQYITEDEDGKKKKHTEITTKYALPDTTALFGALNIFDDEYIKDKKQYELKKQELELRRQMAEEKDW